MSLSMQSEAFHQGIPFTMALTLLVTFLLQRSCLLSKILVALSTEPSLEDRIAANRVHYEYEDSALAARRNHDSEDESIEESEDDDEAHFADDEDSGSESEQDQENNADLDLFLYRLKNSFECQIRDIQIPLEEARYAHHARLRELDVTRPTVDSYPSSVEDTMTFEVEEFIHRDLDLYVFAENLASMIMEKRADAERETEMMRVEMRDVKERTRKAGGKKGEDKGDGVIAAFEAVREWRLRCEDAHNAVYQLPKSSIRDDTKVSSSTKEQDDITATGIDADYAKDRHYAIEATTLALRPSNHGHPAWLGRDGSTLYSPCQDCQTITEAEAVEDGDPQTWQEATDLSEESEFKMMDDDDFLCLF